MELQKSCEVIEELMEKEANTNYPKLSTKQFLALNTILLELAADKRYTPKKD